VSSLVVDASVAVKWFVSEPYSAEASLMIRSGGPLHAPDFFLLEIDNFFCKQIRRGGLTAAKADGARAMLVHMGLQYHSFSTIQDQAYRLAQQTRRSVYDCLYLALALNLDVPLVTGDRRFYTEVAAGPYKRHLMWVGDIPQTAP
jgi:predicted nucleic acid-binding protein